MQVLVFQPTQQLPQDDAKPLQIGEPATHISFKVMYGFQRVVVTMPRLRRVPANTNADRVTRLRR